MRTLAIKGGIKVEEVCALELVFLRCLKFDLYVPLEEYETFLEQTKTQESVTLPNNRV